MISKEVQYRIFSGIRKNDYSGWEKVEVDNEEISYWTLDMENGYSLDRFETTIRRFFGKKIRKINCIRRNNIVEDEDSDYKDTDFVLLYNVDLQLSDDLIKFEGTDHSSVLISREPVDWNEFKEGAPEFDRKDGEESWSSFYR